MMLSSAAQWVRGSANSSPVCGWGKRKRRRSKCKNHDRIAPEAWAKLFQAERDEVIQKRKAAKKK